MRQRQTGQADKLGIYIHIPFCRSKCDYCDFYSLAGREDRMDAYQKALLAHIRETAPLAQGIPVDTVYFGGGTPSWYGARRIQELLSALSKLFQVEKDAEITVEANPDSVDLRALRRLRSQRHQHAGSRAAERGGPARRGQRGDRLLLRRLAGLPCREHLRGHERRARTHALRGHRDG